MIEFRIDGIPPKKDRPRFSKHGTYSTKSNKDDNKRVWASWVNSGHEKQNGALSVAIEAFYEPPASWSGKKKREAIEKGWKVTKPDIDNVVKAVLDGLNGYAYDDDNQVAVVKACKRYAEENYTKVKIEELD